MKKLFLSIFLAAIVAAIFIVIGCDIGSSGSSSSSKGGRFVRAEEIGTISLDDIIQESKNRGNNTTDLENLRAERIEKYKAEMKKAFKKRKLKLKGVNSASDIDDLFENNQQFKDSLCCEVAAFKVDYTTTDPFGEEVTASMRVLVNYLEYFDLWDWSWHRFYACSDIAVLHCHATQLKDTAVPSKKSGFDASECGLLYETCFHDYMVISPDYLGYGTSKDSIHPYLIQENTGKQCWDAACAAIYWKNTKSDSNGDSFRGLENDYYTVAIGYSQGGAAALATQNYIEKYDDKDRTHFRGVVCGDGPYDPMATYKFYTENGMYLPSVITLILRSYLYYYKDSYLKGFTASDFLKDEVITALKDGTDKEWNMIDSKEKSTTDIDNAIKNALGVSIPVQPSDMFKAEAMNPSSAAYKALEKAFAANNLADSRNWAGGTNNHKSQFIHFECDEVVPYVNYINVANALKNTKYINWKEPSFLITIIKAIQALEIFIDLPDIIDDLQKVADGTTPYDGAHVAGGELFFVGDIFYYKDYKDW